MSTEMHLLIFEMVKNSKCLLCEKKDPVILISQYRHDVDELGTAVYCKDCFKKEIPEYTLEGKCLMCNSNFDCNIQNLLFSKKELKKFRKEFWG